MSVPKGAAEELTAPRDTRAVLVSSWLALLGMLCASLAGRFCPEAVYPTEELFRTFYPTDLGNLVIGVPLLAAAILLSIRGWPPAWVAWPGALFLVLYTYVTYAFAVPFGPMQLVYLATVAVSGVALILLVRRLLRARLHDLLRAGTPVRWGGGVLTLFGLLLVVRSLALIAAGAAEWEQVPSTEAALWIADLLIAAPPLLIAGVALWRKRPLGLVLGPGLLLAWGALSVVLIPIMIYQARAAGLPVDTAGVVILLLMAAACLIPFGAFARTAGELSSAGAADGDEIP